MTLWGLGSITIPRILTTKTIGRMSWVVHSHTWRYIYFFHIYNTTVSNILSLFSSGKMEESTTTGSLPSSVSLITNSSCRNYLPASRRLSRIPTRLTSSLSMRPLRNRITQILNGRVTYPLRSRWTGNLTISMNSNHDHTLHISLSYRILGH